MNGAANVDPAPTASGSHGLLVGYLLWLVGFTGAHRFYYGRPITGTIWFCTLGVFGIGWVIDVFLIPSMAAKADRSYPTGVINYEVAWLLLAYLGFFGVHRFYLGKIWTGLLYLVTGGLCSLGVAYDLWTLNEQIAERNQG